jgi:DNA-binding HxlR family transcriptional regulator
MERDGLLTRTAYDENPPRVEYELTPLGRSLFPLLEAARAWTRAHLPTLLNSRASYASQSASAAVRDTETVRSSAAPFRTK